MVNTVLPLGMHLPVNYLDLAIFAIFMVVGFIGYKRGLFATLFDTLSFIIAFLTALFLTKPVVVSIAGYSNFTEGQIGLVVQFFCFIAVWYFLLRIRPYVDTVIMKLFGGIPIFYRFHKQLALLPAVLSGFIIAQLFFTAVLIFSPRMSAVPLMTYESLWNKHVASRVFALGLQAQNMPFAAPYNGFVFTLSKKPAFFTAVGKAQSKQLLIPQNQYNAALAQTQRINQARTQKGMVAITPPPIKVAQPQALSSDAPKQKKTSVRDSYTQPQSTPPPVDTIITRPIMPLPIVGYDQQATFKTPYTTPYQIPASNMLYQTPYQSPMTQEPTQAPQPTPPAVVDISAFEREVFTLTNIERRKYGLSDFVWDDNVAAVARAHSQDMVNRGYFDHVNPDGLDPFARMGLGGVKFTTAAENIAGNRTAVAVVVAWMNSPGHRANILNGALGKLGVGIAQGGSFGYMLTQNFTN